MTNDDGRKPEGAPERSPKAGVGAPSGVDGNGPKRFSVDAAIDAVLDAFEFANKEKPTLDRRFVLIHASLMRPDQMERAKKLGCSRGRTKYVHVE
jgi:hypothetical protein